MGDVDGARDLLVRWAHDAHSGARFFVLLPWFLDADIDGLPRLAAAAAAHVQAEHLGEIVDAMPADDSVWMRWNPDPALEVLIARFGRANELVGFRADRIALESDPRRRFGTSAPARQ